MQRSDYYTYVHRRGDTGEVFYVGKGSAKRAWSPHKRNPYWRSIVAKRGYSVEVVAEGLTEPEAHRQERRLIKLYSRDALANFTDGGEGASGTVVSADTREKLSKKKKGRPHSPQHIAAISAAKKGTKFSREHREKLSAAKRGKTVPAEHVAKIAAANTGKKRTEETKAKMRAAWERRRLATAA